jgi:hypothetical protein
MLENKYTCVVAACIALLWVAGLVAQGTTGDILGTVVDNTGSVVPDAKVTMKNLGTGLTRSVLTNESGGYIFSLLPVGTYSLTVEIQGFKTFSVPTVGLDTGARVRVDATMQLGQVSESVEVVATAAALQTDSSTVGTLVTTKAVQDLPVNGRNVVQLVQLSLGVNEGGLSALSGGGRPDDRRQTSAVSANGQSDAQNNYLVDGMDNNERNVGTMVVKPSIDALAEVKVQTNMYSADVSRTGGAVVNMITKSGTNGLHGTLYEFLRNDLLDAKNFFNVKTASNPWAGVKPKFRQNQFGGSVGGPIRRDKTFYFGDYEGLRIVQGVTGQAVVPTACQLGKAACNGVTQIGNFSDIATPIYDITQNPPSQFPNNIVPLSRIGQLVKNYAALYPALQSSACGDNCNFINSPVRRQLAHTFDAKIDQVLNGRNTLFGRYSFNNTNTSIPGLFPETTVAGVTVGPGGNSGSVGLGVDNFPGRSHQRSQNAALTYANVIRPTLLLQLRAGVTRYVSSAEGLNAGMDVNTAFGGPAGANLGSRTTSGLAQANFAGYGGVGDALFMPTEYWTTTKQINGDVSWARSTHNIRFGGSLIRRLWNQNQSSRARGDFTFGPQMTNSSAGGAGGTGGNSFASFILGYPNSFARSYALVAPQYRAWDIGFYIQDDWRVSRSLTLNLGWRHDIFTRMVEKHNRISGFDPEVPSVLAGGQVLVAGQSGVSRTVNIPTEYGNTQPRLGFALTMAKSFVLRGGFGLSYTPGGLGSPANMKSFPFISNVSIANTLGAPWAAPGFLFGDPLPPVVAASTCLVAACGATPVRGGISVPSITGQDFRNALNHQFNLTLERELAGNILSASYVGVRGRNLSRTQAANSPLPPLGPGGCGLTTTMNLPHPCQPYNAPLPLVNAISVLRSNGRSNYNSLQVGLQRRLQSGPTVSAGYTFARALSDVMGPEGSFTGQNVVPQWYATYDYGNSYFDVRHRLAVTANYELPFGRSLTGVTGVLARAWQLNVIALYSTGNPFTVVNASNPQQNTGGTSDRPDRLTPDAGFTPTIDRWFDTTAFALQKWGTAGNEGANTFYGPSQRRLDLSAFKTIPVTEAVKIQFRAEAFNVTNTPTFGLPNQTINGWGASGRPTQAGKFGAITRTGPFYTPRDIQLALKLLF